MTTKPNTYRVRPVTCPKCGEVIEVEKRKDRSGIHALRMRLLAKHMNAAHPKPAA